ncbi:MULTISPECIES: hypothetical protein [Chryseobacterium]|uniref:hypothetical protein n=1 Tax=Chryseobacterium TaxID=59732 RepID=UPI0021E5975A|nr:MULTISPECIES: hypothetical protein [Chryseobacterium]MEA1850546.1 hypothetical protein [Chryseobacterium sp. MHB01]MEC5174122.1 hypothetical protein [Chryseobacterium nepalense]
MKKILLTIGLFSTVLFFAQKNENYLVVGYHSICCGTPSDKPVMDFINTFRTKNKIKNFEVYRQNGLGREGEFNLYIGTDTFSKTQKMQFVNGLKAAIDAQNRMKKPNRDGNVSFDETEVIKKADLSNARNLTLIK